MPDSTETPRKTRKRRVKAAEVSSTVTIKITRNVVVTKTRRTWQQIKGVDQPGAFAYVDDEWPQLETTQLIEQTVPADKFDLAKVIKAINSL